MIQIHSELDAATDKPCEFLVSILGFFCLSSLISIPGWIVKRTVNEQRLSQQ